MQLAQRTAARIRSPTKLHPSLPLQTAPKDNPHPTMSTTPYNFIAHQLRPLENPGASAQPSSGGSATTEELLKELLKPYGGPDPFNQGGGDASSTNSQSTLPQSSQSSQSSVAGSTNSPILPTGIAANGAAPAPGQSGSQPQDRGLPAATAQLLQAIQQSNQTILVLLEKLTGMMEAQVQIITALDRRVNQLAGQINSLKNI